MSPLVPQLLRRIAAGALLLAVVVVSLMKGARLFVAFEEGEFERVLAERESTEAALSAIGDSLRSMRGASPSVSPSPNGRSARR